MAFSRVQYSASGTTDTFAVTFPFLNRSHVKFLLNGVEAIVAPTWLTDSSVKFDTAPVAGTLVEIRRETPKAPLVTYNDGSVLTGADLNLAQRQSLYLVQELLDAYDAGLGQAATAIATGNGIVVVDPEAVLEELVQSVLDSALLTELQANIGNIEANAEAILEQTNRVDTLQDAVDALLDIDGEGITTYIINETNARIAGDQALADTIALIGAKNGTSTAFILDMSKVRVDATTSLGTRLSGIDSAAAANAAAVVAEQTARASADSALSTSITNLTATVNSNYSTLNAAIATEATARADADTAEATARTVLAARVTTAENNITANAAAIVTEQTVRASADSALSSSITSLTSTVNGHTTSIAVNASSIDGIQGKYTVKIDNNGYVSGYGLISSANNGTPTSEFIVLVDKFAIVTPGKTPQVPFVVGNVGGVATIGITGALIVDGTIVASALAANSITAGKIAAGAVNTNALFASGVVTTSVLADAAITADKIATDAVTANKIVAGAITAAKLAAGSVTADKLSVSSLDAITANIGTITAGTLRLTGSSVITGDVYDLGSSYESGTYVLTTANTERTSTGTDENLWTERKKFRMKRPGTVTVSVEVRRESNPSATAYPSYPKFRIKQGGTVLYTSADITSTAYGVQSNDVTLTTPLNGDLTVEVKDGKVTWDGGAETAYIRCYIKNVQVKADPFPEYTITD
jgi:hypothetical protein